jgi:hypothetical protein
LTCIVGLLDKDHVYIGGDRLATNTIGKKYHQAKKKVWHKKDDIRGINMIFGCAGSVRGSELLKYGSAIQPIMPGQPLEEYLTIEFTRAMKQALHEGGELHDEDGIETAFNHFLLGYEGRLFSFYTDFCWIEVIEKYVAVGSGASYALGSLYSTEGRDLTSEERIIEALKAAEYYNAFVQGEFDIVKIPVKEKSGINLDMDKILERANEKMKEEDD